MDFTLKKYSKLLDAFNDYGYEIVTFSEYLKGQVGEKFVIMRHDVDELANNALRMAQIEKNKDIKATYFFRIVKQSNKPKVIRQIAAMGHEIGYHYEDLSSAEGNFERAIDSFSKNLKYFRNYYPVQTTCMHGSSTSKYDNRTLWKRYRLEDYGLIGEPYLSVDFDKVFYMTDTGYAWDGGKYATRDVVENKFSLTFHSTDEIIASIKAGNFPKQSMILAHTLWTDSISEWSYLHLREFVRNNIKRLAMNNKLVATLYKKLVNLYWKR